MQDRDLVHHGLAIKRLSTPAAIAGLIGLPEARVAALLAQAEATGRALASRGAYTLSPLARVALDGRYEFYFAELRADAAFGAQYERFEVVNKSLKQVITDWQTIVLGGSSVTNDHSNKDYDAAIIDRLGEIHEQVDPILAGLAGKLPRLAIYARKLLAALEAAEDGDIEWVSDIRRESYHTVWFELHEDILRIMGREREE